MHHPTRLLRFVAPVLLMLLTLFLASTLAGAGTSVGQVINLPLAVFQPTPSAPGGTVTPNDPRFGSQWNLAQINATQAWPITTGGPVVLAVVDTGIDTTHEEFVGRMVDPTLWYDFAHNDSDPSDPIGHGSHVAGIAAAASDNGRGIAGVSWGARIMPLKVFEDNGRGFVSYTIRAIDHAVLHGAEVINLSVGTFTNVSALQSATANARNQGVIVVAAVGNCHQPSQRCPSVDATLYPGANPGVIGVAASNIGDGHAGYSTVGGYVDLTAPGGDGAALVTSAIPTNRYLGAAGTSMATPHVAGLAALLRGLRPALTVDDVQFILQATAVDRGSAGWDATFGHGRIDARAALESAYFWPSGSAPANRELAAPGVAAIDCSVPHATDRLLLREGGDAAALASAGVGEVESLGIAGPWQLATVAAGSACEVATRLNAAAGEVIAELDVAVALPDGWDAD